MPRRRTKAQSGPNTANGRARFTGIVNLVANLKECDVGSGLRDGAGGVSAQNLEIAGWLLGAVPLSNLGIDRVHRNGVNAHDEVVRTRLGIIHGHIDQTLWMLDG